MRTGKDFRQQRQGVKHIRPCAKSPASSVRAVVPPSPSYASIIFRNKRIESVPAATIVSGIFSDSVRVCLKQGLLSMLVQNTEALHKLSTFHALLHTLEAHHVPLHHARLDQPLERFDVRLSSQQIDMKTKWSLRAMSILTSQ